MSFITKFIPDPMMITDDMGDSDELGYYDILFSFSSVQEIIETEPQQVVCSYTLQLGDVILSYRFQYSYAYNGSNATPEAAEAALKTYLDWMHSMATNGNNGE